MAGAAPNLTTLGSFFAYRNADLGVVMNYPALWQREEQANPTGFALTFFPPIEGPASQFREHVLFSIQPLLTSISLDDYVQFTLREIQGRYKLTAPTPATLGELPARQLIYTGPLSPMFPQPGKFWALVAVTDTRAFMFRYTARSQRFAFYLSQVQEIIASFAILSPPSHDNDTH
jgi:hypothetical protein